MMRILVCSSFLLGMCFVLAHSGSAQPYVTVTAVNAVIFSEPEINTSLMRFSARKGYTFEIITTSEQWIQIQLFSGEERYIRSTVVNITFETEPFSATPSVRKRMCEDFGEASSKSSWKALSKYPGNSEKENRYRNVSFDEYTLDAFREFDLSVTHYSKLVECSNDKL